ncbi:MAG: CHC2 zinc finger domain-containing protein, partial [Oscillospiraceae bacterium]|nr:CHC2 zinc finger domain-containing protein [Oscillospiraceae bacterium]
MRFPDGFLQEIKHRNGIEEIIARYVTLKQAGSNLVGSCPFHSEKTPSFTVFRNSASFYCFGCGAGGDVVTFIMKIENLDYPSAVGRLADFAGLAMPADNGEAHDNFIRRKRIFGINREAALYFHDRLMNSENAEGEAVRGYVAGRGIKNAAVKRFGLGYAPGGWDSLTKHLTSLGYSRDELRAACLCSVTKTGSYVDFFRERLMFPVIDVQGNVIAFGGRALGDSGPKYLNSADTPAFKKSRNLYA